MPIKMNRIFLGFAFSLISLQTLAQCTSGVSSKTYPTSAFEITYLLVDACGGSSEGQNEMFLIDIGPNPLNIADFAPATYVSGNVNWGSSGNPFQDWATFNSTTSTKINTINSSISSAGNCGLLIPLSKSDQVPANSTLLFITSEDFNETAHSFADLQDTLYVALQKAGNTGGHFANYGTGTRTLILLNNAYSDTITYDRSKLLKQNQAAGAEDGGAVSFDYPGNATYVNYGCKVYNDPITVDAGTVSSSYCSGSTVKLNGDVSGTSCFHWSVSPWNAGSFTDSTNETTDFSITSTSVGQVTLYLAAFGKCGNSIYDSLSFQVNPSGSWVKAGSDTTQCSNVPIQLSATDSGSGTLTWVTSGNGSFSNNTILNPIYYPTINDSGWIWMKITKQTSCGSASDSLKVYFAPKLDASFFPSDTTICSGNGFTLLPKQAGGTFQGQYVNGFTFTPTSTGTFTIWYHLSFNGCVDSISHQYTVVSSPDASFSMSDSIICLSSGPVSLSPLQSGGTFLGLGVSGQQFTPSSAGTFNITYTLNSGSCSDTVTKSITVVNDADASFSMSDTVVCLGSGPVTLSPLNNGGTFFGNGVNGSSFTPPGLGTYTISYALCYGNCCDTVKNSIRVVQIPKADFTLSDTIICPGGGNILLKPVQSGGTFSGIGVNDTLFTPTTIGDFTITYTISLGGCNNTANHVIHVIAKPDASFSLSDTLVCAGSATIRFFPKQTGGVFSGNGVLNGKFDPVTPGTFTITHVIAAGPCSDTVSHTIQVLAAPVASFTTNPVSVQVHKSTAFTFTGSGANKFAWNFGDGTTDTSSNPNHTYNQVGTYLVQVIVMNAVGCSDTFTETIQVLGEEILIIPNTFSPNSDLINDTFLVTASGLSTFNMRIYNRWGEFLFESLDVHLGWDGTFHGVESPTGVYYYIVEAKGVTGKSFKEKGTITLIR